VDIAAIVGAGTSGALIIVIGYLLNSMRLDRSQYEELVTKAEARADTAEQRVELREEALDSERRLRRTTEDQLALVERQLAAYRDPRAGGP
jgi:hypothetical protein